MKPPLYDEIVFIHEWVEATHGAQVQVSANEGDSTRVDIARVAVPEQPAPIA